MKRSILVFLVGVLLGAVACTPAQIRAAVPAVTQAACVLIHGFVRSGHADTICATAEDLAPFVAELIAEREAEPVAAAVAGPQRGPALNFAVAELPLPEPKKARAPAKRRCASWLVLSSDGGALESKDGGDGGG